MDSRSRQQVNRWPKLVGVHLEPHVLTVNFQAVHPRQRVKTGRNAGEFGGNRRPSQVAQLGQSSRLGRAPFADDADSIT